MHLWLKWYTYPITIRYSVRKSLASILDCKFEKNLQTSTLDFRLEKGLPLYSCASHVITLILSCRFTCKPLLLQSVFYTATKTCMINEKCMPFFREVGCLLNLNLICTYLYCAVLSLFSLVMPTLYLAYRTPKISLHSIISALLCSSSGRILDCIVGFVVS